jgi:hypothetical protein
MEHKLSIHDISTHTYPSDGGYADDSDSESDDSNSDLFYDGDIDAYSEEGDHDESDSEDSDAEADSDKADGSEKSDEDTPAFGKFTTDLDEILGIRRQTVLEDREEGEKPDVVYQVGIVTKETWAAKGGQWLVWNEDAEDRLRNTAAGKSRTLMPEPDLGSGVLG